MNDPFIEAMMLHCVQLKGAEGESVMLAVFGTRADAQRFLDSLVIGPACIVEHIVTEDGPQE